VRADTAIIKRAIGVADNFDGIARRGRLVANLAHLPFPPVARRRPALRARANCCSPAGHAGAARQECSHGRGQLSGADATDVEN